MDRLQLTIRRIDRLGRFLDRVYTDDADYDKLLSDFHWRVYMLTAANAEPITWSEKKILDGQIDANNSKQLRRPDQANATEYG